MLDDGESTFIFEPLLPAEDGENWRRLAMLASEVRALSDKLSERHGAALVADVMEAETRASFLIEGEKAADSDIVVARCALAEASRHSWLSEDMLRHLHGTIASHRPDVMPGFFRTERVAVGRHVAPSPGSVSRLVAQMARTYGRAGRTARLIGAAAGHHRLSWVHPFLDWNGRVCRLATTARLHAELPAADLWSLSEGIARRREDYLMLMAAADEPRRGDRDGRGNLSEMRLSELCAFLLEVMRERIEACLASM